jgi:hypothetical protein
MTIRILTGLFLCLLTLLSRADQVVMQNGDHYHGKVVSVTNDSLVLQSDILGTVNLSRGKVAQIILGNETPASKLVPAKPTATSVSKTNATVSLDDAVRQLKTQPALIQQVQNDYLSNATPEAKAKFDQMLTDLASGKMSVGDLRAEAKSAANQLRSLRKELGDDAGEGLDGYLAILDNFVQETAPAPVVVTNAIAPAKTATQPAAGKR